MSTPTIHCCNLGNNEEIPGVRIDRPYLLCQLGWLSKTRIMWDQVKVLRIGRGRKGIVVIALCKLLVTILSEGSLKVHVKKLYDSHDTK